MDSGPRTLDQVSVEDPPIALKRLGETPRTSVATDDEEKVEVPARPFEERRVGRPHKPAPSAWS
jgi:hypothetical protein